MGLHEQDGLPPISRHSEFSPQGDGTHGFITTGCTGSGGGAVRNVVSENVFGKQQYFFLRGIGMQRVNGSPVNWFGQLQIGLWLITLHLALIPQVPGQGSMHFWFIHAFVSTHSELTTHSGRHLGGLPL